MLCIHWILSRYHGTTTDKHCTKWVYVKLLPLVYFFLFSSLEPNNALGWSDDAATFLAELVIRRLAVQNPKNISFTRLLNIRYLTPNISIGCYLFITKQSPREPEQKMKLNLRFPTSELEGGIKSNYNQSSIDDVIDQSKPKHGRKIVVPIVETRCFQSQLYIPKDGALHLSAYLSTLA